MLSRWVGPSGRAPPAQTAHSHPTHRLGWGASPPGNPRRPASPQTVGNRISLHARAGSYAPPPYGTLTLLGSSFFAEGGLSAAFLLFWKNYIYIILGQSQSHNKAESQHSIYLGGADLRARMALISPIRPPPPPPPPPPDGAGVLLRSPLAAVGAAPPAPPSSAWGQKGIDRQLANGPLSGRCAPCISFE